MGCCIRRHLPCLGLKCTVSAFGNTIYRIENDDVNAFAVLAARMANKQREKVLG